MNNRTTGRAFVLLSLGLILAPLAHAGVVTQTNFVKAAMLNKTALKQQRSHLEVLLDLSGYRNATVAFDFAALMRRDSAGFRVTSTSNRMNDDIRGQARSSTRANESGFSRSDAGRRYSTAMFNLAAYDGQTVMLTLDFNRRAAQRRGVVNINNLRVAVAPAETGPFGAAIPEPSIAWLMLAGVLGLLLVPAAGAHTATIRLTRK